MNLANSLNLVGLSLNIIGAFLMYYFTPKIKSSVSFSLSEEYESNHKKDVHKNRMIRFGILILFMGFIIQALTLFISH